MMQLEDAVGRWSKWSCYLISTWKASLHPYIFVSWDFPADSPPTTLTGHSSTPWRWTPAYLKPHLVFSFTLFTCSHTVVASCRRGHLSLPFLNLIWFDLFIVSKCLTLTWKDISYNWGLKHKVPDLFPLGLWGFESLVAGWARCICLIIQCMFSSIWEMENQRAWQVYSA